MNDCDITYKPEAKGAYPLLEEMWVERGDRADWDLLSGLHYKMHSTPVGAKYWRLRFRGQTIGVCVFGMSRPLLKERHAVFPKLKPGMDTQISNIARYAYINDGFRVIGRFVVDTQFRSAGVAYRFANLAARMIGYRYAEIQSSMSKHNHFAQRAGFSMVKPIRSLNYDKGLKFMRRWFAAHPADQEALMDELKGMSPAMQVKVTKELKTFYFAHSPLEKTGSRRFYAEGVVENWDARRTISKIQGLCFASPLYGFYRNPDACKAAVANTSRTTVESSEDQTATIIPKILPLLAFDLQPAGDPLRVDVLNDVPGWDTLKSKIIACDWSKPTEFTTIQRHSEAEEDDDSHLEEAIPVVKNTAIHTKRKKK